MENFNQQFAGRVAIVTGSTQGLGEACARLFINRGAAGVVICGRNSANGQRVTSDINAQNKGKAVFVQADLERIEDCRKITKTATNEFGKVDILVNSAACTERANILNATPQFFDKMFALNVRAPFFLIQDAAKVMRSQNIQGHIVNILSVSSHGGQPFISVYSGTKAALATLTRNIAFSLLPNRIRVNGLNIGWMETPGETVIQTKFHNANENWAADAGRKQPFGRLLQPEEIARAVAFLSSDESGIATGSIIDFDQGVLGCYEYPPTPSGPISEEPY